MRSQRRPAQQHAQARCSLIRRALAARATDPSSSASASRRYLLAWKRWTNRQIARTVAEVVAISTIAMRSGPSLRPQADFPRQRNVDQGGERICLPEFSRQPRPAPIWRWRCRARCGSAGYRSRWRSCCAVSSAALSGNTGTPSSCVQANTPLSRSCDACDDVLPDAFAPYFEVNLQVTRPSRSCWPRPVDRSAGGRAPSSATTSLWRAIAPIILRVSSSAPSKSLMIMTAASCSARRCAR